MTTIRELLYAGWLVTMTTFVAGVCMAQTAIPRDPLVIELAQAHARIAALEAQLAEPVEMPEPEPAAPLDWSAWETWTTHGATLLAGAGAILGGLGWKRWKRRKSES